MNKVYGENIFKAIVEGYDDKYLSELERIKEEGSRGVAQDFQYPSA